MVRGWFEGVVLLCLGRVGDLGKEDLLEFTQGIATVCGARR